MIKLKELIYANSNWKFQDVIILIYDKKVIFEGNVRTLLQREISEKGYVESFSGNIIKINL